MTAQLAFGLNAAIPATVGTAWGARLIFPDDLLHDRQDITGDDVPALVAWLNGAGALRAALVEARRLSERYLISPRADQRVILHRDDLGVVVACPNGSGGYLYVAAWLHQGAPEMQPGADFVQHPTTRDPWEA